MYVSSEASRCFPPGPKAGEGGGAEHRADEHGCRQGCLPRASGAQGQAQRHRPPRPHAQRLGGRPRCQRREEGDHGRRRERRLPEGGGRAVVGHPSRVRRPARLGRLPLLRRLIHHRFVADDGDGRRYGEGGGMVRQRVGVQVRFQKL